MEQIIDLLNIPKKARTNIFIPKKAVLELNIIDSKNKKIINESIVSVYLKGEINENTFDINSHISETENYSSILVIAIELKTKKDIDKIDDVLQRVFPNPVLLVFKYINEYRLSMPMKRISKLNADKVVILNNNMTRFFNISQRTDYLKRINLSNPDFFNLKEYYESYYNLIKLEKHIDTLGFNILNNIDVLLLELINELETKEKELSILKIKYSEKKMEADKMKWFVNIKGKENEINKIVRIIKERK